MLFSHAFAQSTAATTGASAQSGLMNFLPLILMFVVLYFIMIRPQIKRQKEHRTMLAAITKGDEVATSGGVVGRVTKVSEAYITLEIADGVESTFQKHAVTATLPKGTLKSL